MEHAKWNVALAQPSQGFTLEPTPARRTINVFFDGKPDLDAIKCVADA